MERIIETRNSFLETLASNFSQNLSIPPPPQTISYLSPATDCMVSEWTEWSECNKSCGKGHTIRTRMVKLEPQFGGEPCPETVQRKKCKIRKCKRGSRASEERKRRRGGEVGGGKEKRRGKQQERDAAVEEQPGQSSSSPVWHICCIYTFFIFIFITSFIHIIDTCFIHHLDVSFISQI